MACRSERRAPVTHQPPSHVLLRTPLLSPPTHPPTHPGRPTWRPAPRGGRLWRTTASAGTLPRRALRVHGGSGTPTRLGCSACCLSTTLPPRPRQRPGHPLSPPPPPPPPPPGAHHSEYWGDGGAPSASKRGWPYKLSSGFKLDCGWVGGLDCRGSYNLWEVVLPTLQKGADCSGGCDGPMDPRKYSDLK